MIDLAFRVDKDHEEDEIEEDFIVRGYMGKNKGKKQILWERGLWVDGMQLPLSQKTIDTRKVNGQPLLPESMNVDVVLNNCADFKFEPHLLQKEIEDRGHILLVTVVCSPEFAGGGIEYGWGYLKFTQRGRNAKAEKKLESGEAFKRRVKDLFEDEAVITMERVWKYQRRARDYIRLYLNCSRIGETALTHKEIEQMREKAKTHRNVGEGASARFIANS